MRNSAAHLPRLWSWWESETALSEPEGIQPLTRSSEYVKGAFGAQGQGHGLRHMAAYGGFLLLLMSVCLHVRRFCLPLLLLLTLLLLQDLELTGMLKSKFVPKDAKPLRPL